MCWPATFVAEDRCRCGQRNASTGAARDLIESGQPLFLAKTTWPWNWEWVLRGYYGSRWRRCLQVFRRTCWPIPALNGKKTGSLEQAVAGVGQWARLRRCPATHAQLPQLRGDGVVLMIAVSFGPQVASFNLAQRSVLVTGTFLSRELGPVCLNDNSETAAARSWVLLEGDPTRHPFHSSRPLATAGEH